MRYHTTQRASGILANIIDRLLGLENPRTTRNLPCNFETLESRTLLSAVPPGEPLDITPLEFSNLEVPDDNYVPAGVSDQLWSALQVSDDPDAVYSVGARSDGDGHVQAYINLNSTVSAATLASSVSGLGLTVDTYSDDLHVVQAWIDADCVDSLLALSGVESLGVPG
jgi:hypothetical protein